MRMGQPALWKVEGKKSFQTLRNLHLETPSQTSLTNLSMPMSLLPNFLRETLITNHQNLIPQGSQGEAGDLEITVKLSTLISPQITYITLSQDNRMGSKSLTTTIRLRIRIFSENKEAV